MDMITPAFAPMIERAALWIEAMLAVVVAASLVTALTPSPKDDGWLMKIRRVLELLALNVGHAGEATRRRPGEKRERS